MFRFLGTFINLGLGHYYQRRNELYPIGIHPDSPGADSEMILVREVAMMIIMDRLTDKPEWHIKVFDDAIAEKWIDEGLALPAGPLYKEIAGGKNTILDRTPKLPTQILDRDCLEYCIKELRVKAEFFNKTGLIPTLDANASVAKSDSCVNEPLHESLRAAFDTLKQEQGDSPDWYPNTDGKVLDLVHSSLYPLIYGRTRVFRDEVVGLEDAIDKWAGKGESIESSTIEPLIKEYKRTHALSNIRNIEEFWSTKYQWLPSNVVVKEDGSVKFTSYINNLHPKHREIYGTIEKLIEKALPAWDVCLAQYQTGERWGGGRTKLRFPVPKEPDDEVEENWTPKIEDFVVPMQSPGPEEASVSGPDSRDEEEDEDEDYEREDIDGNMYNGRRSEVLWKLARKAVHPPAPPFEAWKYGPKDGQAIRERFNKLQIIVKIASIELTPEKPNFPAGGWHVEGKLNEHIVGTALYYLDSENVTPSHLAFRTTTTWDQDGWNVGQDSYTWMERVFGTFLGLGDAPCLQNYGSVETREGRLLAFPNVFHHRVSPFELVDKTKPGHRRFIALWLVDPLTPIISTGNVPPQQQSWLLEGSSASLDESVAKRLPPEVMQMIRQELGDAMPMSLAEAKEHRLKLMDERTAVQEKARSTWNSISYNFCEH